MLTNEQFREKIYKRDLKLDNRKDSKELYYNQQRVDKLNTIGAIEKDKIAVEVPIEMEKKFYRSQYVNYNTQALIRDRSKKMKEYYCVSGISIEELQEQELEQMLSHYRTHLAYSNKGFSNFIKQYVIIDESLLHELISITSTTREQRYRKRTIWLRHKELNYIGDVNTFKELERLTKREKDHIKQMYEYNQRVYKKHSEAI